MVNRNATLYLMAFPVGLMGLIQAGFALLSWLVFHDKEEFLFFIPGICMLVVAGFLLNFPGKLDVSRIGFRESMLFATVTWVLCGSLGAIPILLITHASFTDSVFESLSGLTTAGATILSGLDKMPKTFLMYRQFLQWLGGLGVVVFVVAILPMLNIGGMKLLKAEMPGPVKDEKLSPRIAKTAHYLWMVYLVLTVGCAISYYVAGMSGFDALAHAFTTVSTGGFSTHDASMAFFHSPALLIVSDVFMLLGAISFALLFKIWRNKDCALFWRDEETRIFLFVIVFCSIVVGWYLLRFAYDEHPLHVVNNVVFHLISFITSTGYGADNFTDWPIAVCFLLVVVGYLGGCSGSTAGGNKILRNILCIKLIGLEIKRLVHPGGVFTIKYNGRTVDRSVICATVAFMVVATLASMILTLVLMATGLDFWSAFTAVAACLNVLGPAFGELSANFQVVSDLGIWTLSLAMVLGRLEYFTVLALIFPAFWR